jgi:hypothetical protein
MAQQQDRGKAATPKSEPGAGEKANSKKKYATPVLIEYGTVAKLTQGTRTKKSDGGNFKRSRA